MPHKLYGIELIEVRAVRKPVVIDIEHWPLEGNEAQMRVNLAKITMHHGGK